MVFHHSIKARAIGVMAVVFMLQAFFSIGTLVDTYEEYRRLRLAQVRMAFELHCENLNKRILLLQKSVQQMALQGEMYLAMPAEWRPTSQAVVRRVLADTPEAVGGGMWFEPYKDDPKKLRSCAYFDRNKGGLRFDSSYEGEEYNYLNQMWYSVIKERSRASLALVWTPPYLDSNISGTIPMVTLGCGLYYQNTFKGMVTLDWELSDIADRLALVRPTKGSFALLADLLHDVVVVNTSQEDGGFGTSAQSLPWLRYVGGGQNRFSLEGLPHVAFMRTLDNGMAVVLAMPEAELYAPVKRNLYSMVAWLSVFMLILLGGTWYMLQYFISKPVQAIANKALAIGRGDFSAHIPVTDKGELGTLAHVLNTMTKNLQEHMTTMGRLTKEKERIAAELDVATRIQTAMLPCIFPPFPDRNDFDIYASMRPAREVGGDFYDFFLVDKRHLALIIGDVSGKGVPAALFMVIAKTLLKNHMQGGLTPCDALSAANKQLCENNSMNMFVTVWAGLLTLESGHLRYSNAGHNKPLWSRQGGAYVSLGSKRAFVLGGLESTHYTDEHCTLAPGDRLLLYTDGITEAENSEAEQFGVKRLRACLDGNLYLPLESSALAVTKAVDDFVGVAPQTDDITQLLLGYGGPTKQEPQMPQMPDSMPYAVEDAVPQGAEGAHMSDPPLASLAAASWKCRIPAEMERLAVLRGRLEIMLDRQRCPHRVTRFLLLALEEVFVNIVHYAYPEGLGEVHVKFSMHAVGGTSGVEEPENAHEAMAVLCFKDRGRPFNPLEQAPPDVTASTLERPVGGLGIHMLQKMMDVLEYTRKNGENILTLTKRWRVSSQNGPTQEGENSHER